ncbi:hypothetical protein [Gemmobacter megaterium]|uniref:hypothetical protein n=1 Tax=Gemmobacter megaterium TaxID=1086013 RepID=UPI001E632AB9|nr:hypothetical protein [Gemmobacter megaterium]
MYIPAVHHPVLYHGQTALATFLGGLEYQHYQYNSSRPFHAPLRIVESGVTTNFSYDATGNMLVGLDNKAMTYDGENRPLSVTLNGNRTCYVYAFTHSGRCPPARRSEKDVPVVAGQGQRRGRHMAWTAFGRCTARAACGAAVGLRS